MQVETSEDVANALITPVEAAARTKSLAITNEASVSATDLVEP